MGRQFRILLVGVMMSALVLATAGIASTQEVEASPTINSTPDSTWMTNGIVYSIVRSGDYVYVGGKFTRARSATNGKSFLATNIARFDADTGIADPTWTPDVTGADMTKTRVYALAAAGGKIWIGGKFEAVDGLPRQNLAAVSEASGAVDGDIDPVVGSTTDKGVRALLASDTKVYLGGHFRAIDGKSRTFLAAMDLSGNLDPAWRPKTDKYVQSLAYACDRATVFAGGKFRQASSPGLTAFESRETIARFDATTGSLHPWAIPSGTVPNDEVAADLAVTCERITGGYLGRNYVRSFHLDNGEAGTLAWENKCAGNVQTVAMLGADKVIIGGHFSQIQQPNGQRIQRTRIAKLDLSDGSVDTDWAPAVDGSFYGPWDLLVDENHLYVGGAFTTVAGVPQTHFARFTFTP